LPGRIPFLGVGDDFPPGHEALDDPNGLLAAGGDLSAPMLLAAYRHGVFPWYEEPQPVLWWSPDPRTVLLPDELHISRSLRRVLRRDSFGLAVDTRFGDVMRGCAEPREDGLGTWIGKSMLRAYTALHYRGLAHSVEVLDADGELVGGLYGVALGRVFFGESMFSRSDNASKVAMVGLVDILRRGGFHMIDCQVCNPHLLTLGARELRRLDFESRLAQNIDLETEPGIWTLPGTCGGLA
jgi:leucyl/phenylalanyl-tRNA--protein transferase